MKRILYSLAAAAFVLILVFGAAPHATEAQSHNPITDDVPLLVPEVISVRDHSTTAFTEGLIFSSDGMMYESAGLYGESTLRQVDPETGEVLKSIDIPEEYFAEGLAQVGDHLIQLTWQENTAFVYDIDTFEQVDTFSYEGEGWGLCYDGAYLYQSDGTSFITLRDPETFDPVFSGLVSIQGQPVANINELECVGDSIWANLWKTDYIIRIDKSNGVITGVVDTTALLTADERAQLGSGDVLNGIAYNPDTDTFLITGKNWPHMYEVRFVDQAEAAPSAEATAAATEAQ
ncbi:MAG TPA: glutaminyl-peptide cyclotransferase [Aggregatilinea sp.]|uniref:glutaminyl-peptide cyclotransferase n=1 Tax=Aggregatilinea sp. TaxID=2806333 RepID=UPI002BC9F322|nr:glutaminyl-peptide cyclotransferase [Aggregatilinea sp.]HML22555.1 glutaminyl-peptide cyclotransferase [Aggregatilinea sp.]